MAENNRETCQDLLEQAQEAYQGLRLDEALECYRAAEAASPRSYKVHLGLCRTLSRMRRVEAAYAAAKKCIDLDPDRFEGYAVLGALHWLTDRNDEAVSVLQRAIDLAPKAPQPHLTLAQVYADMSQLETARAQLDAARDLVVAIKDDDQRNSILALAKHVETYLYLAEGEDKMAMETAQETVDLEDVNPYVASLALSNIGILHARARRYVEAIEYFERAQQMNPFLRQVGGALGRLLLATRRYERAAEVLGETMQYVLQDNGSTRHAYASALAKMGRREEARKQYRQALAEGLSGPVGLTAWWQIFWLSRWGHSGLVVVVAGGVLGWVLLAKPSPTALTLVAVVDVILLLQTRFGRGKR